MNKRCSKCGEIKNISFFSQNKSQKGGYSNWCKNCDSVKGKIYYKNNKEQVLNRIKKYIRTPDGRESHRKVIEKYRKNNPEKYKAHIKLGSAIRNGKIKPASYFRCSMCKTNQAAHYHHHRGYEEKYWLDVIPVCAVCHKIVG